MQTEVEYRIRTAAEEQEYGENRKVKHHVEREGNEVYQVEKNRRARYRETIAPRKEEK